MLLFVVIKPLNSAKDWAWQALNFPTFDKSSLEENFKPLATDKDFNSNFKLGDKVLEWEVTSVFGKREKPCPSCSSDHKGVDINTPIGTPLYAIGEEKSTSSFHDGYVDVACPFNPLNPPEGIAAYIQSPLLPDTEIALFHLSECYSGRHPVGAMIAKSGDSGASMAPHLHYGVKVKGEWIDPPRGYLMWILQGKKPQSTLPVQEVKPFLDMIRFAEGTDKEDGYKTMFSGAKFNDFSKHPDKVNSTIFDGKVLKSAAAGAYQFMPDTWERASKATNAIDFSPPNQDRAAVFLIKERGALDLVKQEKIKQATFALCEEWASLPCYEGDTKGAYNQAVKPIDKLMEVYKSKSGKKQ